MFVCSLLVLCLAQHILYDVAPKNLEETLNMPHVPFSGGIIDCHGVGCVVGKVWTPVQTQEAHMNLNWL